MRPTAAELACELRLLETLPEPSVATSAIEAEVMSLFEQYRASLLRYAISFGVAVPDAEEIVQEVFLALFRHLQLGRSRENLRGWIFRVTHNLALKRRHANGCRSHIFDNDADSAAAHPDPLPDPEQFCLRAERQQRLQSVVDSMPEVEQSCLRLRAEGLRYREIAAILGISLGSVSMILARSFAKLIRVDRR